MRVLKIIIITIIALIVVIAGISLAVPTEFKMERSTTIDAPKEVISKYVTHFEKSYAWSPWADLDTNQKTTFEGEPGQPGAVMTWKGNEDVGQGSQEIMSVSDERVDIKVTFIEPFESVANSYFVFDESEEGVKVTWGFDSEMPRPFNVFSLFMDMSEEIGKDYEKGLANLKEVCEEEAEEAAVNYEIEMVDYEDRDFLAYRKEISFDEIKSMFEDHLPKIYEALSAQENARPAGQPCGIYYSWNEDEQTTDMAAAVPFIVEGDVEFEEYDMVHLSGKALKVAYYGDYEEMGSAHEAIHRYMDENELEINGVALEEYVTDPSKEPDPANWLTNIYYFMGE